MVAAEQSGDPLLTAASAWRLSCMITSRKHPQEALELAMTAAAALERTARRSPQNSTRVPWPPHALLYRQKSGSM